MDQQPPTDNTTKMGKFMAFGFWLILLVMLTVGADRWLENRQNLNRIITTEFHNGKASVLLEGDRAGHYFATGTINDQAVRFLLDTGATGVSIPLKIAQSLDLKGRGPVKAHTANGVVTVQWVVLDQVGIGEIKRENVRGTINPHMDSDEVLLGMSFLRHFELIQRGERLTIQQP